MLFSCHRSSFLSHWRHGDIRSFVFRSSLNGSIPGAINTLFCARYHKDMMSWKLRAASKLLLVRCTRWVLKGLVVLILLICLLPSFRNTIIPVPNAWHPLSTLELMKALKLFLNTPGGDGLAALSSCTDPAQFEQHSLAHAASTVLKYEPLQAKDAQINTKELYDHANNWVRMSEENHRKFSAFLPLMTIKEKEQLIDIWRTFHGVCTQLNITYIFLDGSALGVLRHRGLIPWDDDIDVGVDVQHLERLQRALSCVPGYTLRVQHNMHWKFFPNDAHITPAVPPARTLHSRTFGSAHEAESYALKFETSENVVMRFPFLDLFFTTSDESGFTWALNSYTLPLVYIRNEDLYPVAFLPFEGYLAPVPRNIHKVMEARFNGLQTCVSPSYNHREGHSLGYQAYVPCKDLAHMYPMVSL